MTMYPRKGMLRCLSLAVPASLLLWAGILWAVREVLQ